MHIPCGLLGSTLKTAHAESLRNKLKKGTYAVVVVVVGDKVAKHI